MSEDSPVAAPLSLDVEEFPDAHPGIHGAMLLEHARTALARHGGSPRPFEIHWRGSVVHALVAFSPPDPRSALTLQRPDFGEYGAVVMAGLVMYATAGLQLTRVTRRGSSVDYFVGREPGQQAGVVEVGGTDEQSLVTVHARKRSQVLDSFYSGHRLRWPATPP